MIARSSKVRVLIVDDNPANRMAFESLLESRYSVAVAASGVEALGLALQEDFAVILLDVRMPGMDGFEVADVLRKRERTRFTPIVFMSAFDKTDLQMRKGYVAGATDFIFSPVDEEILKFKVAAYVSLHLRNELLRFQIRELQGTLYRLQAELTRSCPVLSVQEQMRRLKSQMDELKTQINPLPA